MMLLCRDVLAIQIGGPRQVLRLDSPPHRPAVLTPDDVRRGKGGTDRVTMLRESARLALEAPLALDREAPAWATDPAWEWVFPAAQE